uniref:Uncharacterized protein n=1 Tax=Anopheles farauti TaxID=69004 RepID=A0A182QCP9_9DIPT
MFPELEAKPNYSKRHGKEQSHKSYRPLCVLTFRWNYLLHGLEPAGYHLVNVLLHTIVSLMYFRMCAMLLSEAASFAAALLFAVHPIHTEANLLALSIICSVSTTRFENVAAAVEIQLAMQRPNTTTTTRARHVEVTGVVGRAETLSSVFFLAAFIFYTKATRRKKSIGWRFLCLSMLFVATAMLCKEQGITITGVCAIYEIFVAQKLPPLATKSSMLTWLAEMNAGDISGSKFGPIQARCVVHKK